MNLLSVAGITNEDLVWLYERHPKILNLLCFLLSELTEEKGVKT